ncbi:MAG: glycoside hydrolase family 13 protein [Chryseolinea sp.]
MKKIFLLFAIVCISQSSFSQKKPAPSFQHVEPAFWWIGMKNTDVQILFHNLNSNVSDYAVSVNYPGVSLKEVKKVENSHYLFLTLFISPSAQAGNVPFTFELGKKSFVYNYELRNKSNEKNRIQGFNSSDVMYLIMPDRFANGNPNNDTIPGMFEGAHREKPYGRHGGDLKGISDHLDYIKDFGVTAIWLNPVLENNVNRASYHGYAITDLYKVDARLGTNEEYVSLINKSHQLGLKVIQDMVMNHIGTTYWLVLDLPEKNWIHQFPTYTTSNYRGQAVSDPYQSKSDLQKMSNGWFDTMMADVDQTNPLFATYLIQNSLWWIEYAGIDGIRMDTYPYPDKNFMAQWAKTILEEYPSFNLVGEVWINNVPNTAYWQKDMINKDGYNSYLPSVTDFPLYFAIPQALNEQGGWDTGMARLYNLLGQDFAYPNANGNLIFLDNHDLTRFYLSIGRDMKKLKMALAFLLTTRGIPQLYYGTELLMDGDGSNHSQIRKDFPGGWAKDSVNAFSKEGRTPEQNEAYDFMKKLLNWRMNEEVIHSGKLTHYIPEDNVYVYFRSSTSKTVMVIMNANPSDRSLDLARFKENLEGFGIGKDILSEEEFSLEHLSVPAQSTRILLLK